MFQPTFESLKTYQCPDWFRDAKFGIWSHWGPQSVPMCGDWYARNMYVQGSPQYNYHIRHYGHPSKFGYKDICRLWKAENFHPDELMDLYTKAGARYFVAQAMHHDHFFNYATKLNRFNSVEVGPHKDICALWKKEADRHHIPFGLTEHLGASFSWWNVNKGCDQYGPYAGVKYDGNDPEYRDFYYDNYEHVIKDGEPGARAPWLTSNPAFHRYWLDVMKELVDLYHPDLLYSDSGLPFEGSDYQPGLEAVSYLYNDSIARFGENKAVYTQKNRDKEIYSVGVLDIEKSQLPGINDSPWQTDTCIGNWFYDAKQTFKQPGHVIEMLVDIISKNGTMLLNILQLPDGSIDEETRYLLNELAKWFQICAEGVYGTRPFRTFGEGDTRVVIKGFTEDQTAWNSSDYRFVQKDGNLYAFVMKAPDNRVSVIKSLKPDETVNAVELLGYGPVAFAQNFGVLTIQLPETLPTQYTNCLKIKFKN